MTNLKKDLILIYGPEPVAQAVEAWKQSGFDAADQLQGEALECFQFLYPEPEPEPRKKQPKPAPVNKPHKPGAQNEVPKKELEPEPEPVPQITEDPEPEPEPVKKPDPIPGPKFTFHHDMRKTNLFKTDLWKCCGKDQHRPVLMRVNFKNGFAYATDAYIVCKQSLEHIHGFSNELVGLIEGRQLMAQDFKKLSGPGYFVSMDETGIKYVDKQGTKCFIDWAEPENFPDVETVIPSEFAKIESIGINPELVTRLSEAMATEGSGGIRLKFVEHNRPILVHGSGLPEEYQTCILMPMIFDSYQP